jgi:hypothetical protein
MGSSMPGIGAGVDVGGIGVYVAVGGIGVIVGGTGVDAGAHPLNNTIRNIDARNTDRIDFFMTLSPFDLLA